MKDPTYDRARCRLEDNDVFVLHQFFDVLASWEVENACLSYVFNVFETRVQCV